MITATATVIYSIGVSAPITPAEPLPPLLKIPRGSLVVVEGRAPIWRCGMALHLLHGSPAAAVAFRDPRLGAVVVEATLPQADATQLRKPRCRMAWPH